MADEPRKAYIVIVEDTEVRSREYVTLATSEEEASKNILEGFFVTESDSIVIEHLNAEVKRAELLDESFAVKIESSDHERLLDQANRILDEEKEGVAP